MSGLSSWLNSVLASIWTATFYASILLLLVLVLQKLFDKQLSPKWRCGFSLLVLIRFALPVAPESSFSIGVFFPEKQPLVEAAAPVPEQVNECSPAAPGEAASADSASQSPNLIVSSPPASFSRKMGATFLTFREILPLIWLAGFFMVVIIAGLKYFRFARWLHRQTASTDARLLKLLSNSAESVGVRKRIPLIVSHHFSTAAVFGVMKPVMLLPRSLVDAFDEEDLQNIVKHELAHIRCGDTRWVLFYTLLSAVHWFNPLIWISLRRFQADRELVCDELAADSLSPAKRKTYGRTLIRTVEEFATGSVIRTGSVPVVRHKQEVKRRLAMMATIRTPGKIFQLVCGALLMGLCLVTFTVSHGKQDAGDGKLHQHDAG